MHPRRRPASLDHRIYLSFIFGLFQAGKPEIAETRTRFHSHRHPGHFVNKADLLRMCDMFKKRRFKWTTLLLVLILAVSIVNIVLTLDLIHSETSKPYIVIPKQFVLDEPQCADKLLASMNITNVHVSLYGTPYPRGWRDGHALTELLSSSPCNTGNATQVWSSYAVQSPLILQALYQAGKPEIPWNTPNRLASRSPLWNPQQDVPHRQSPVTSLHPTYISALLICRCWTASLDGISLLMLTI